MFLTKQVFSTWLGHCKKKNTQILSTGGTAALLKQHNIAVTDVSSYTGFPEVMDGRVKTLHPKIYGGILHRPGIDDDILQQHDIACIDLVVVNLYPFQHVINNHYDSENFHDMAIENIDIGGPSMLRAAAKNYQVVTVVTDHQDYPNIIAEINNSGAVSDETRLQLAQKVFQHTANYDTAIANFFSNVSNDSSEESPLPSTLQATFSNKKTLRYGENPHQQAAFYQQSQPEAGTIAGSTIVQGKPLSYNNIADADTALECIKEFDPQIPSCVIVKHANPCGVACSNRLDSAYHMAFNADPVSAFGGIIAINQMLDATTANAIITNQFAEVIIAPAIHQDAVPILTGKPNIRMLTCGSWPLKPNSSWEYKSIHSGLLVQQRDVGKINIKSLRIVSKRVPTDDEMNDLVFSWKVAKFVKSNAIVFAKDSATLGIGAGQMNRLKSVRIASEQANKNARNSNGSVMASDAFFPFSDGVEAAIEAGITAIIQPGGSIRDDEVIKTANGANIAMVFTGMRHFRH